MGLLKKQINTLLQSCHNLKMSAKMRVDLFGREGNQVVPELLLNPPLF